MENNNNNPNPNAGEKTFTQDDVNRIVGERLAKEKSKGEQDFSKREQELQKRELLLSAKEMLADRGMSAKLIDALNYTDKESLEKSISVIQDTYKEVPNGKPTLRGCTPGQSGDMSDTQDISLRKAMGLHN